jgi:hypothetical protein
VYLSSKTFRGHNKLFTKNRIHDDTVIQEDKTVDGCWWIYEELYRTYDGYEAHMMFADKTNSYIELTIISKDITLDKL